MEECCKMTDADYFEASKMWEVMMKDVSTGKMKQSHEFSEEAKQACQEFFDETSQKLETLQLEAKHHMMSNYSKIRDLVMRVSAVIQVMEFSLNYLASNEDFDFHSEDTEQPMLPDILSIEPDFIKHAIAIIEASQEQKDIFSGDSDRQNSLAKKELELIEKDVLLLQGKEISGTRNLVRRNNPYNKRRCTKEEHEHAFKSLSDKGIGVAEEIFARNGSKYWLFKKKTIEEISQNPKHLDNFPKSVKFSGYQRSMS